MIMSKQNRARALFVAQMLAGEITSGRKRKGAPSYLQLANGLTGSKVRTKREALAVLVRDMRDRFGYVPTATVRRAVTA